MNKPDQLRHWGLREIEVKAPVDRKTTLVLNESDAKRVASWLIEEVIPLVFFTANGSVDLSIITVKLDGDNYGMDIFPT